MITGSVLEWTNHWRSALPEDDRECMDCYVPIDVLTQDRNGGLCNDCADRREIEYWCAQEVVEGISR